MSAPISPISAYPAYQPAPITSVLAREQSPAGIRADSTLSASVYGIAPALIVAAAGPMLPYAAPSTNDTVSAVSEVVRAERVDNDLGRGVDVLA